MVESQGQSLVLVKQYLVLVNLGQYPLPQCCPDNTTCHDAGVHRCQREVDKNYWAKPLVPLPERRAKELLGKNRSLSNLHVPVLVLGKKFIIITVVDVSAR